MVDRTAATPACHGARRQRRPGRSRPPRSSPLSSRWCATATSGNSACDRARGAPRPSRRVRRHRRSPGRRRGCRRGAPPPPSGSRLITPTASHCPDRIALPWRTRPSTRPGSPERGAARTPTTRASGCSGQRGGRGARRRATRQSTVTPVRSSGEVGHVRFMPSSVATRMEATAQLRYHFLSAGITCQGACFVLVCSRTSSNASW